jgi:hypothetical protein
VAAYYTKESAGYAEDKLSSLNVPIYGKNSSTSTNDARLCNLDWEIDLNTSRDAKRLLLLLMSHFC